jgi:pyruvate/2-oxoglutarate dehydrogenase complex dihydrolipoamide acyltransferase (E2) component
LSKRKEPIGNYRVRKASVFRRLLMDSLDAIPPGHNMMALLEFDVTEARAKLRKQRREGKAVSLFAFLVKSIAVTIAENKELNSIRSAHRIVEFEDVDVSIPIELGSAGEMTSRQLVIRRASEKTVERINEEIEAARARHRISGEAGREDRQTLRLMKRMFLLPRFVRTLVLRKFIRDPFVVKRMSGTTFVTSVSMYGISGFAVPYLGGPKALSIALGSVVRKPVQLGTRIVTREILSVSVFFNHDIVDGAPAARFANSLRKRIESADVL